MNYRTWHLLVRGGFVILIPALVAGHLLPAGPVQRVLKAGSALGILALGVAGVIVFLLVIMDRMRLACPSCRRRDTRMQWSPGGRYEGFVCRHCGTFEECGPFRLKLRLQTRAQPPPVR
jgi:hypothetical protein